MPLRLFQLRRRDRAGQKATTWEANADDPAATFGLPMALITAAAIFGIGGAAVGLFALQSSLPASAEASEPAVAKSPEPKTVPVPARAGDLALASNATSLDQDEPTNARLRDGGVGLVPRVVELNTTGKYAVLGAGAIESTFRIPFGWHAIDDGQRTLIFDAEGKVQVHLNLRQCGADHKGFLEGVLRQHLAEQPDVEHLSMELSGMQCLAMRNYRVGGEVLQQAFVVKDIGDKSYVLVARITADDENMARAMDLGEVLLADLSHGGR